MDAKPRQSARGLDCNPQAGSVAEYLAKPTPPALHRRIAVLLLLMSVSLFAFAVLSAFAKENGWLQVLPQVWEFSRVECAVAVALLVSSFALFACTRLFNLPRQDLAVAVKKAALRALVNCPRAGIAMSTPVQSVRMRSFRIAGTHGRAVNCWLASFKLLQQDFSGFKPSDFGAVDFEVAQNGHLYVYFDRETANRVREKRYARGGERNARRR